ncbi:hypothetical protein SDC9_198586 [bioreactor metagenome]|uniref:Uncharacterized protein n=1 Tax=bioreactor metagenome TaxID=1076179 RepID=A0A645IIX8_9ZZZZ
MGRDVKPRPVVCAAKAWLRLPAAFPPGRNARAAAKRDKQQRHHAAVSHEVSRAVLRNIFKAKIGPDIGVFHIQRHKIVKPSGFFQRLLHALRQLRRQNAEIRGKQKMGRLLRQKLLRRVGRLSPAFPRAG